MNHECRSSHYVAPKGPLTTSDQLHTSVLLHWRGTWSCHESRNNISFGPNMNLSTSQVYPLPFSSFIDSTPPNNRFQSTFLHFIDRYPSPVIPHEFSTFIHIINIQFITSTHFSPKITFTIKLSLLISIPLKLPFQPSITTSFSYELQPKWNNTTTRQIN